MTAIIENATTSEKQENLDFAEQFSKSSRFDLAQLARQVLQSSRREKKEANPTLLRYRDQALDHKNRWKAKNIRSLFKKISKIISPIRIDENGTSYNPIGPRSSLAQYLIGFSTSDESIFKTTLHDVLNAIAVGSALESDQQKDFFQNHFPPQDLNCLGGTGSRIEDALRSLTIPKAEHEILGAYQIAMSKAIDIASPHVNEGNEVHLTRYLDCAFNIVSENEAKKIDNYAMTCSAIPATISIKATNKFFQSFAKRIAHLLSPERGKKDIEDAVREAIRLANADPKIDEDYIESFDFKNIPDDPPGRKLLTAYNIISILNKNRGPDEQLQLYDFQISDQSNEDIFSIDQKKLASAVVEPFIRSLQESMKRFGYKPRPENVGSDIQTLPLGICDDLIKKEIRKSLFSEDLAQISHAVDILFNMSNRCYGAPHYYFHDILMETGYQIAQKLTAIAEEQILPQAIIEKISGNENTRYGILERFNQVAAMKLQKNTTLTIAQYLEAALLSSSSESQLALENLLSQNLFEQAILESHKMELEMFNSGYDIAKGLYYRSDFSKIIALLDSHKNNVPDNLLNNLLILAAMNGDEAILDKVLSLLSGRSKNLLNDALRNACFYDNFEAAEKLLRAGANPDSTNNRNKGSLLYAAQKNNANLVELLLANKANPNTLSTEYDSPLNCAVNNGNAPIVNTLLEKGADPLTNQFNHNNNNPIFNACKRDFTDIAESLIGKNNTEFLSQRPSIGVYSLEQAVINNNQRIAQALIGAGVGVNKAHVTGTQLSNLEYAAARGYNKLAINLMESGAMVTQRASKNANVELKAIIKEVKKYVTQLRRVIGGRSPKLFSRKKPTLNEFLRNLNPEIRGVSLRKAILNYQNSNGENLLLHCVKTNNYHGLESLIDNGANAEIEVYTNQDLASIMFNQPERRSGWRNRNLPLDIFGQDRQNRPLPPVDPPHHIELPGAPLPPGQEAIQQEAQERNGRLAPPVRLPPIEAGNPPRGGIFNRRNNRIAPLVQNDQRQDR